MTHLAERHPPSLQRPILYRTRGQTHGPITRLVSPGDLGALIKPFVFLDLFRTEVNSFGGFGWHPHSGIATVTVLLKGASTYEETTGAKGVLHAGGVEFMRAGRGVWHTGGPHGTGSIAGFQLWVALPPSLETGPNASHYLQPHEVPTEGDVRVILGSYGQATSPICAPSPMNYLVVNLTAGQRWSYHPPAGHSVGFLAVSEGALAGPSPISSGELVVFEPSTDAIEVEAMRDSTFVLGSAVPHAHELVLGQYSVHSSEAALEAGENEIVRLARQYGFGK